ncbi:MULTISPECIES: hypothetical protein, partial [Arenibacter]|uniref:hypothetical protein n=1 Tax=Arenibacter TaxID=178469 RepID=UPI001962CE28
LQIESTFLVVHFHPAKVVHFHPARVAHFNPARVVYYDRFLHFRDIPRIPTSVAGAISICCSFGER